MAMTVDDLRIRTLAADQNRVDLAWERCQEQALQAFRDNRASAARDCWARALDIAERHFERGDPRLAASRSNQAFALMRKGHVHQANTLFKQAIDGWKDSWRWVPLMQTSAERPDGAPDPFGQTGLDRSYAMIRQGQAVTEMLFREGRLPDATTDEWPAAKRRAMDDVRRLISAILLMPTARPQHRMAP